MSKTGRLEKVEIRDHWPDEARDFTPWMADKGGLEILAEALGLKLEFPESEVRVGTFSADILCQNTADDSNVLIENQYGVSNHDHIGKLLTYSADLGAYTAIWIAEEFHEKHHKALNHLNQFTDDTFQYFAVKVSLWRIGDSKPAPRFDIVCKPCGWEQRTPKLDTESLGETQKLRLKYWAGLREYMVDNASSVKPPTPTKRDNVRFSIGKTKFTVHACIASRNREIGIRLYMAGDSAKPHYHQLKVQQEEIHSEFGETLEWDELPTNERSRISLSKQDTDPLDENDWAHQYEWFTTKLDRFDRVFRSRITKLNAGDLKSENDDE